MLFSDYLKHLEKRETLKEFNNKHPDILPTAQEAVTSHNSVVSGILGAGTDESKALTKVTDELKQKTTALELHGTFDKSRWAAKPGSEVKFKASKAAYDKAAANYEGFLSGRESVKIEGGAEVNASEALKESFKNAAEKIESVKGGMDGLFSMMKLEGAKAAATHNLKAMNLLDKNRPKASNNKLLFLYGTVGVGAGMTVDAFARSKTKEGEQRSAVGRFTEAVAGAGIATAGILSGHAR